MTNLEELKELEGLTEEERKEVLKILGEISDSGSSKTLKKIELADYSEPPVDINTFLHDPMYLGKGLTDAEGRFTLFPYWEKLLNEIYPDPLKPARYNTLALTGAIGIGKSTEAVVIGAYELHRMMCLKDPYVHYGIMNIDTIAFAVINITLDASRGVAWSKLQALLQSSKWFMDRGSITKSDPPEWKPPTGIELICGSQPRHFIGKALYWSFFDEISFIQNQDVEKQKEKATELISSATARMQSRFMRGDKNPTILVLASSKRTEQSYLETFIENKKKQESKTTRIVDEPQWVIRTDKDSAVKFKVAVGNKFLNSEVVPLDATDLDLKLYRDRGYTLLDVPMGYYETFLDDIDIALTDVAGISTSGVTRYIAGSRVAAIKKDELKNLFTKEVIEVGNSPDDTSQYSDFIDLERLDRKLLDRPLFIHLDMSLSGDKTGIAGVWIKGKKPSVEGQPSNKDLFYTLAFHVSVKAPKGYQVSFEKNRQFIRWLKEKGFAIKGISSDTYQSADLLQQMSSEGFNTTVISVDRVNQDRICLPYQTLKNAIYEQRVEMYDNELLTEELIGLERDNNGKIDHSPSGINCFTGDTKIQLLDGTSKTILELLDDYNNGKINYVYSFNHESEVIEPKKIKKVFKSGNNAKLVEITLDNGEVIKCTPEHLFMLRNGEYIQAQDLLPNDSLMPLYTKYPSKGLSGYRMYYEPMEDKWHYEHRSFAKEVLDERYLVHHKDCNPKNNRPDNLIWMSKKSHTLEHARLQTGAQSEKANKKRAESVRISHKNVENTKNGTLRYYSGSLEERKQKKLAHDEKEQNKQSFYKELSKLFNVDFNSLDSETRKRCIAIYANYKSGNKVSFDLTKPSRKELNGIKKQNQIKACEYYNVDINTLSRHELHGLLMRYYYEVIPGYKEHIASEVSKNHKKGKYNKAHEAIKDRVWWTNGKLGKENNLYIKVNETPPEGFVRGRTLKNHKVVSIKFVDYVEDVYDIEVEDNHNFALSAGVFVHNSKDSADAVCGALWNASQHAEEFSFEYGDTLDTIVDVSSKSYYDDRKQVVINFEEELKKTLDKDLDDDIFMDFGMGKATSNFNKQYLSQGIIVF